MLSINHKNIFLVDAIGALLSLLGLIAIKLFFDGFGMPLSVVKALLFFPLVYFVFSFCCFIVKPKSQKLLLFTIAIANFLYAVITSILISQNYTSITTIGLCYFILEIIILLFIVATEIKLATQSKY